eukprot:gene18955-22687_t
MKGDVSKQQEKPDQVWSNPLKTLKDKIDKSITTVDNCPVIPGDKGFKSAFVDDLPGLGSKKYDPFNATNPPYSNIFKMESPCDYKLNCTYPAGSGASRPVIFKSGQCISTDGITFSYGPPSIAYISAVTGSGGALQVDGDNFGSNASDIIVTIGNDDKVDDEVTIIPSKTNPFATINSSNNTSFELNIKEIREHSPFENRGPLVRMLFADLQWTLDTNDTEKSWTYSARLPNKAEVKVELKQSNETREFNYGNVVLSMAKGSLKYTIYITSWPFISRANHLEIIFQSETFVRDAKSQQKTSKCVLQDSNQFGYNTLDSVASSSHNNGQPVNKEVLWFKTNNGYTTMFARFLNKAILDDTLRTVRFERIGSNETSGMVEIALLVPFFYETCVLDPDYQVFIDPQPTEIDCPTYKDQLVLPAIITIIVILAVASTVSLVVFLVRRSRQKRFQELGMDGASPVAPPSPNTLPK